MTAVLIFFAGYIVGFATIFLIGFIVEHVRERDRFSSESIGTLAERVAEYIEKEQKANQQ